MNLSGKAMTDEQIMNHVNKLALRGSGYVSPNPRVGAVIVKNGKIISEGWHRQFGESHAEVDAIENSGMDNFEDCELFVNLEPCSYQGKTPPCADLIIDKKFSRVVIGTLDPNPLVSGKGIRKLEAADINVKIGVLENDCKWVNRYFFKHITTGLPYITAKAAQSLDGCIATSLGESKWISCDESRRRSHLLRSEIDAVLIGRTTASTDNPKLTVRNVSGRNQKRIILDSKLALPLDIDTLRDANRINTIICCKQDSAETRKAENLRLAGVHVLPIKADASGRIDI
ncbi:MAG: diaminohydroxyphosphoribosylaminopyrimidine deaminase, partial [Bacteroidota bacterium]|nr:diaminohydroxyphosphoribosylaminopyrimidine deaminase [Bacteroidota bacterium]